MKSFLLALLIASGAAAEPRPINDAEREAVKLAAEFLSRGPSALYERLSPDAPLRALSREDAIAEIAARTGPHASAHWTLQTVVRGKPGDAAFRVTRPNGDEDGLLFRMRGRGLHEILTLGEDASPPAPVTPLASPKPMRESYLMLAAFLALIGAVLAKRSRILAGIAIIGAALSIAGAFHKLRNPFERPAKTLPFVELRAKKSPAPSPNSPLAYIQRARLALTKKQTAEAVAAYTQAVNIEPLRDDVLYEAATAFGVSESALPFLRDPRFDSSRDARLHYERAMRALSDGDEVKARQHLRTAWTLEPVAREEIVREPRLNPLLRDVGTMSMVSFYSAEEPMVRSSRLGKTPIALPAGAQAFATGDLLTINIGKATLDVPAGATLAPASTRVVAATHRQKEDDAAALRSAQTLLDAKTLLEQGGTPDRMRAAEALAEHNRWNDLVRLTGDITPKTTSVEPALLVLRLRALLRTNRVADAQALANGAAVKELSTRTSFPATLLSIADAMASSGSWDTAESIYSAIQSDEHEVLVESRVKQLELRRALETNGSVINTPHFDIRHDPRMNPAIASRIGDLLEAERTRVRQRLGITADDARRVTVNVLYWEDFSGSITGVDHIVGMYDGEILFPFAVVNQFKPELVGIITHELTHALVAAATGDNAPRWFQEGIAERMELVPQHENAFQGTAAQLVLPLPLLDAVMNNTADPDMAEHAYRVAQTFIRFLESRHPNAVPTLIAAFASGKNTDDAVTELTGKSLDALNRDFRAWGFANNGNFVNDEPFPYRDLYSPGVDPRIKAGFKWSRPRAE